MAMVFRPLEHGGRTALLVPEAGVLFTRAVFWRLEFVLRYGLTLRGRGCRRTVDLGLCFGRSLIPFRLYSSSHGKSWSGDPPHAVIFPGARRRRRKIH